MEKINRDEKIDLKAKDFIGVDDVINDNIKDIQENEKIVEKVQKILKRECFCEKCNTKNWIENHSKTVAEIAVSLARKDSAKRIDNLERERIESIKEFNDLSAKLANTQNDNIELREQIKDLNKQLKFQNENIQQLGRNEEQARKDCEDRIKNDPDLKWARQSVFDREKYIQNSKALWYKKVTDDARNSAFEEVGKIIDEMENPVYTCEKCGWKGKSENMNYDGTSCESFCPKCDDEIEVGVDIKTIKTLEALKSKLEELKKGD